MKRNTLIIALFSLVLALLFASCQKDGQLQERPVYTNLGVTWKYSYAPAKPYDIYIDGLLFADSLKFDRSSVSHILTDLGNLRRFQVIDADTKLPVLDTLIAIKGTQRIQLIQLFDTEKAYIYTGDSGQAEPDPDNRNKAKIQFIYSDPKLPDSVILNFYTMNSATRPYKYDTDLLATVKVRRREFSPYVQITFGRYARNTGYLYQILNAADNSPVQNIAFPVITTQVVTFTKGWCNTLYEARNTSTGNPPVSKFITAVLRYGGPAEPTAGNRDKFYDLTLFKTAW